jgi:hypothetical protein
MGLTKQIMAMAKEGNNAKDFVRLGKEISYLAYASK